MENNKGLQIREEKCDYCGNMAIGRMQGVKVCRGCIKYRESVIYYEEMLEDLEKAKKDERDIYNKERTR